jgi:hypothetical protein
MMTIAAPTHATALMSVRIDEFIESPMYTHCTGNDKYADRDPTW